MSDKTLLEAIEKVIDKKLKDERINTREMMHEELGAFEKKFEKKIDKKLKASEERLSKKISASAEDVIDSLKVYIEEGYDQHNVRISRIEDHLGLPPLKH